jgi:nitric oxide reductase subunit B
MERIMGVDFMETQMEIKPHFLILVLCASVFVTGIVLYIINFFQYGKPTDEALITD